MSENPPSGKPRVCPCLFYDDLAGAVDFLGRAFGFEKRFAVPPAGEPQYAEVALEDGVFMLSTTRNPSPHGALETPATAGSWASSLYVYVDDVDAHCARARAAGASILDEPSDQFWGDRIYTCLDPERHFWTFATHVRDVSPEDLAPPAG